MKEQSIYVSGSNYFNESDLQEMINQLDKGNKITVGISCIGHTRNNAEQENYKDALLKHYGERLEVIYKDGVYSYHYDYKLKDVEKCQ